MAYRIIHADVMEGLASMAGGSAHVCVTSPPYWGLRSYAGVTPSCWPAVSYAPMPGLPPVEIPAQEACLGLEKDPWAFIGHLVAVWREVWRVLRDDGTCWLNVGDAYATQGGNGTQGQSGQRASRTFTAEGSSAKGVPAGLRPKSLVLMPERLALALAADGWIIRSRICWAKGISMCPTYSGSVMPESVTDRPTSAWEHVWLLAKGPRYYYDSIAAAEPFIMRPQRRITPREANQIAKVHGQALHRRPEGGTGGGMRNLRNCWAINPEALKDEHYATYPTRLVKVCVQSGTSERGTCPGCGTAWVRVVDKKPNPQGINGGEHREIERDGALGKRDRDYQREREMGASKTLGWSPGCACDSGEPVPATVLDCFAGSCTTGVVAARMGRAFIGIEASKQYCEMGKRRIEEDLPLFQRGSVAIG